MDSNQLSTEVTTAEARQAGEIHVDEGDGHEKIISFLSELKVI